MRLYSYWRSSASYRVRIGLNLKGLAYDTQPINLLQGQQGDPAFADVNPAAAVPVLQLDDGRRLTQSMAILRYLDQVTPSPALLPDDPFARAQVYAAAQMIASDIHPLNNLKVGQRLKALGHDQTDVVRWMNGWMRQGLTTFKTMIGDGPFCFGDAPTLADLCLIPQLYNAHRWGTDLTGMGRLLEIEENCLRLAPFLRARPEEQPDAA